MLESSVVVSAITSALFVTIMIKSIGVLGVTMWVL